VLVLSGIPSSVGHEVERAYRHLGMGISAVTSREGWIALVLRASW
jgi:ribosomal protein L11 methylase PrmA